MWPFAKQQIDPAHYQPPENFDAADVYLHGWLHLKRIDQAVEIERACFGDATDDETYKYYFDDPNIYSGVADYKGWLIGFYFMQFVDRSFFSEPNYFRLISMAVHPCYQRRGIGTRFIATIKDRAMTHEVYRIVETCHEHNEAAQRFYSKCGFKGVTVDFNAFHNPDGTRSDGYVMELIL